MAVNIEIQDLITSDPALGWIPASEEVFLTPVLQGESIVEWSGEVRLPEEAAQPQRLTVREYEVHLTDDRTCWTEVHETDDRTYWTPLLVPGRRLVYAVTFPFEDIPSPLTGEVEKPVVDELRTPDVEEQVEDHGDPFSDTIPMRNVEGWDLNQAYRHLVVWGLCPVAPTVPVYLKDPENAVVASTDPRPYEPVKVGSKVTVYPRDPQEGEIEFPH